MNEMIGTKDAHTESKPKTYGEENGGSYGIPEWMKELKKGHGCLTGGELLPWEDHPSHANGRYYSEPYGLSRKDIEELEKFCRKYGLTYRIRADFSRWYPGHTLLLEIKRRKEVINVWKKKPK